MKDHPHLNTIRAYYRGCSTGDVELMKSTCAPDVVHYFISNEPIRGAEALAKFWRLDNAGNRRTVWTVDHAVVEDDEAVVEWTAIITFLNDRPAETIRGAEWYVFRYGKIAEIRGYYGMLADQRKSELIDFPYSERDYPVANTYIPSENQIKGLHESD